MKIYKNSLYSVINIAIVRHNCAHEETGTFGLVEGHSLNTVFENRQFIVPIYQIYVKQSFTDVPGIIHIYCDDLKFF